MNKFKKWMIKLKYNNLLKCSLHLINLLLRIIFNEKNNFYLKLIIKKFS